MSNNHANITRLAQPGKVGAECACSVTLLLLALCGGVPGESGDADSIPFGTALALFVGVAATALGGTLNASSSSSGTGALRGRTKSASAYAKAGGACRGRCQARGQGGYREAKLEQGQ